jgi:hypothetical protein
LPIVYSAALPVFDPSTGSISFLNPLTQAPGIPVIAFDDFDLTFHSLISDPMHRLLSSSYYLDPFTISHEDDLFLSFGDVAFDIMDEEGVLLSGRFGDILFDKTSGDFTGAIADLEFTTQGSFLQRLYGTPSEYQFMSPMNAKYFYALTNGFDTSLAEPVTHPHITLMNHNTIPEPTTWLLFGTGLLGLLGLGRKKLFKKA